MEISSSSKKLTYKKFGRRLVDSDLRILAELERDARQPLSQLARKLKISQQLLNYRLQSLQRKGILFGFYTMINFTMFGYSRYRMMVRLNDFSPKNIHNFISYLMEHPNVQWLVECGGKWDFIINFMAKNIIQMDFFLRELKKKFPDQIQNYEILTPIEIIELGRSYFTQKIRKSEALSYFGREYQPTKVDHIDLKILSLISENARMNSVEISEKIGVTPNTVIQRIKNLRERKIIHAFRPLIHLDDTPYSTYKFPIKFQNISEEKEKELVDYLIKDVHVVAIIKFLGKWDLEIEFEVDSGEMRLLFTRRIRNKFKNIIQDFEVIPLFHEYRYNFFPKDLLEK